MQSVDCYATLTLDWRGGGIIILTHRLGHSNNQPWSLKVIDERLADIKIEWSQPRQHYASILLALCYMYIVYYNCNNLNQPNTILGLDWNDLMPLQNRVPTQEANVGLLCNWLLKDHAKIFKIKKKINKPKL